MNIKRAKKLAAIVMALMLSVTMMAGCSETDMGYWNLYMEASKVKSATLSGDYTFEINPEALGAFGTGQVNIKMEMTGSVIQADDDVYADLTIKYGINDAKMPQQLSIFMDNNAMYMPVKDIVDIAVFGLKYGEGMSQQMCDKVKAALLKELTGKDYLLVADFAALMMESGMGGIPMTDLTAKSYEYLDVLTDSFNKMLKGFESGMTKKTTDGYVFEMTPDNTLAFADRLVDHISKNKKTIFNELINIVKATEGFYEGNDEMKEMLAEAIIEMASDEQGFNEGLDYVISMYKGLSDFDREALKLSLKGSYLKHTISKSGAAYTDSIDCLINYKGEKVVSLKGKSKTTPATVTKKAIDAKNPITMEELTDVVDKAIRQANPAKEITITWDNGSDWVWMSVELVEGSDWGSATSNIENGTMYLPMRQICEWFGEEVVWDSAAKKAYIVRGDVKTDMTGKIVDNKTLIKIRDFEKLGYTVTYEYDKEWKEHQVVIKK